MSEKDLDNLLESIDLGDAVDELKISTGEDIKPSEKEGTKPSSDITAVGVQVGGATELSI